MKEKKNLIEAALFIAGKPLSIEELKTITGAKSVEEVKEILEAMRDDYEHHGIELIGREDFYELKVKELHIDKVSRLAPNQDFSRGILQTLSVIAYKNPIKQSEIVKMRGNRAYEHLKELSTRGFIRAENSGHTKNIYVTNHFLEYFGLQKPEELRDYFKEPRTNTSKKAVEET